MGRLAAAELGDISDVHPTPIGVQNGGCGALHSEIPVNRRSLESGARDVCFLMAPLGAPLRAGR